MAGLGGFGPVKQAGKKLRIHSLHRISYYLENKQNWTDGKPLDQRPPKQFEQQHIH
jgi:hypothetical protein